MLFQVPVFGVHLLEPDTKCRGEWLDRLLCPEIIGRVDRTDSGRGQHLCQNLRPLPASHADRRIDFLSVPFSMPHHDDRCMLNNGWNSSREENRDAAKQNADCEHSTKILLHRLHSHLKEPKDVGFGCDRRGTMYYSWGRLSNTYHVRPFLEPFHPWRSHFRPNLSTFFADQRLILQSNERIFDAPSLGEPARQEAGFNSSTHPNWRDV